MTTELIRVSLALLIFSSSWGSANGVCQNHCGKFSIPYPFGLFGEDESCYLPYFAPLLFCNKSENPPKPIWGNVEVVDIDLVHGQISFNIEASYDCYSSPNSSVANPQSFHYLNLDNVGSTFTFSESRTKFVAIGCDTQAFLRDSWGIEFETGCTSQCTDYSSLINDSCSGVGCCQTSIPRGVKNLNITITSTSNHSKINFNNPCSFAFLVDKDKYTFSPSDLLDQNTNDFYTLGKRFPVVVDWAVAPGSCDSDMISNDYACRDENSRCINSTNGLGYICNCSPGFEGNPYISGGCTDIDECSLANNCTEKAKCINNAGGYSCKCPDGSSGDGQIFGSRCTPKNNRLLLILLLSGLIGLLLVIVSILIIWGRQKRKLQKLKAKFFQQNGGELLEGLASSNGGIVALMKIFSEEELKKATNNFHENQIVGEGGYGTVYKATLSGHGTVAIKKSKLVDNSQIEQFINEIIILYRMNQRHVVRLLGCCLETQAPMLVYEFVTNGTLFQHIHGEGRASISLENRLRIAAETAGALAYLHFDATVPIVHRDVKSQNILLDNKLMAKVSDFGASRLIPLDQTQISTLVQWTLGYLDPEYFHSGQLTEKSDVYSFGVVLVELLTGEQPISNTRSPEERSLTKYFISAMENNRLFQVLEERVVTEGGVEILVAVAQLACKCLRLKGDERPSMREVGSELEGLRRLQNQEETQS